MDAHNVSTKGGRINSPPNQNRKKMNMSRKTVYIPDDTWLEALKFLTCPQWSQKCFVSRQINGIAQRNISRLPKMAVDFVHMCCECDQNARWFKNRDFTLVAPENISAENALIALGDFEERKSNCEIQSISKSTFLDQFGTISRAHIQSFFKYKDVDVLNSLEWLGRNVRAETIYIPHICWTDLPILANFLIAPSQAKQCASKKIEIGAGQFEFLNILIQKFRAIPLVEGTMPMIELFCSHEEDEELPDLGPNLIAQEVDSQGNSTVEAKTMRRSARLTEKQKAKLEKEAQKDPKENQLSDKISKIAIKNDTTAEAEKMRRFERLKEKKAKPEKEVQMQRGAKKNRSDNRISKTSALDNDTMVEAFKHLSYCQLANNGLVSKRFRDLIQTNRHSLARLHVYNIAMNIASLSPAATKIFDKVISPEAYNEWVIRNSYSKQAPFEDQVATKNIWSLRAIAFYGVDGGWADNGFDNWDDELRVFSANAELTHENWPLFQHIVPLATDPFVYLGRVSLTYQNDVLSLLAGALNSDHSRLQCKTLRFKLSDHSQKFFTWAKYHVRCNQFDIEDQTKDCLNQDKAFVDFFLTGAHCTSSIDIRYFDISQAMVDFVKKFMDLKNCDEYQIVDSIFINHNKSDPSVGLLKHNFADFLVKEERVDATPSETTHVFEFINDNIGKKLQLTTKFFAFTNGLTKYTLKHIRHVSGIVLKITECAKSC